MVKHYLSIASTTFLVAGPRSNRIAGSNSVQASHLQTLGISETTPFAM